MVLVYNSLVIMMIDFIFTTDNGGLLDVKTDKFFIGTEIHNSYGSDGNIEISSSIIYLDPSGNLLVIKRYQINFKISVSQYIR